VSSTVDEYANWAALHGVATLRLDVDGTHRAYDEILQRYRALRGAEALEVLRPLLSHPDAAVRAWSATHFLNVDADAAVQTLREVAKGTDLIAFAARTTLEEWQLGRLQIEE
jgi:hypothetical protein